MKKEWSIKLSKWNNGFDLFEQILVTRSWPCKCKSSEKDFYKILFCLRIYLNIKIFPYANLPLKYMTPELWSLHCIQFINNKYYGQFVDTISDLWHVQSCPILQHWAKPLRRKPWERRVTEEWLIFIIGYN